MRVQEKEAVEHDIRELLERDDLTGAAAKAIPYRKTDVKDGVARLLHTLATEQGLLGGT